jgi:imidazolonepropionase
MAGDLLVTDIGELATPLGFEAPRGPEAMGRVARIKDAAILAVGGRIGYAGPGAGLAAACAADPGLAAAARTAARVDAKGCAVVPGFVDSHTHFVFAGYRADEFIWKAQGLPYMEIHRRGGGIARSVASTRAATLEELRGLGKGRLAAMLELGVTTVEGKSGYGLDLGTELRQLEAMAGLSEDQPVSIVPTFLGPHSIPPEYMGRPSAYIDYVIAEVLPAVKAQGVAKFCDIFCEKGIFELDDSRRYLEAARGMGFGLKLHADEIERIGGAGLAAELGAASADHLLKASPGDIAAMARAGVVAGCLPLTAFTLREPYADARAMVDSGCALALASDLNPGSCYSQSIPLIFALAVLYLKLSVEEALTALTLGGAASLGLADRIGSIEPGKEADFLVLDAPSIDFLPYHAGMNLVTTVVKGGELALAR